MGANMHAVAGLRDAIKMLKAESLEIFEENATSNVRLLRLGSAFAASI